MSQGYWVKTGKKIQGPFSGSQLRVLAQRGQLRPSHQVSADQQKWVPAQRVGGLTFSAVNSPPMVGAVPVETVAAQAVDPLEAEAVEAEAAEELSAILPDEMFEDRRAAPLENSASDVIGIPGATAYLAPTEAQVWLVVPQRTLGVCLALGLGVLSVLATIVAGVLFSGAEGAGGLAAIVLATAGVATISVLGTSLSIALRRTADRKASAKFVHRYAYLPLWTQTLALEPGSRLLKQVKRPLLFVQDAMIGLVSIPLLAMGVVPGIVLWVKWWKHREELKSAARLTLLLETAQGQRIKLLQQFVPDYFGTRYGDSTEVVKIAKAFSNVADLEMVERLV